MFLDLVPIQRQALLRATGSRQGRGSSSPGRKCHVGRPSFILRTFLLIHRCSVSVLVGYILFTVLIELSERFQLVNGTSPQTAGINLLPFLGASAFCKRISPFLCALSIRSLMHHSASGLCGWLSSEKNRSFYTITFGASFVVLGTGLMSSLSFSSSIPHLVYFYEVILGLGVGSTIVSTIIVVKLNASEEDAGRFYPLILGPPTCTDIYQHRPKVFNP